MGGQEPSFLEVLGSVCMVRSVPVGSRFQFEGDEQGDRGE
jgi:hypothetical protein